MKGGIIVAEKERLFDDVCRILVAELGADGTGDANGGMVIIEREGRYMLVETMGAAGMYEVREEPYVAVSPSDRPGDQTALVGLGVDCRDERFVASTMALLAARLEYPCWFIDGNDNLWPCGAVDPERVLL
jgi:hypothetical protein